MKKRLNKIIMSLMIIIILINSCATLIASAVEISSADLITIGNADYHLKYYREDTNSYRYIICTIVGYNKDEKFYPAYCMNKDLVGVTKDYSYSVNINEMITRDDVWRVVKNGYPYKTAQELGVANEFDAYTVTKMAVYCILGESDINKFYAEQDDPEANSMLNALRNLVNIGINGNEKRNVGNFSIDKTGNLIEEGKFYYQNYKITSNVETENWEINGVEGLPNECFVKKIDNLNIRLYIPKEKLDANIKGKINIKGKCKNYPIFYGESGNPETQDYIITYNDFGEVFSSVDTNIEVNSASLEIYKTDAETKNPINNVKFGLYRNGELLKSQSTDKNGYVKFENLYQGEYEIKELETKEEYILNKDTQRVNLEYNKNSKLYFTNEHKKGNLKILKFDADDKNNFLGGVEFELYNSENNLVGKYTTDVNGEITINNLNIGEYVVKEIKAKNGYELLDEINTKINWNKTTELELTNEKTKGRVKVIKKDKENNEIKIPNVEFGIFNKSNTLIEKIKTDEKGEAISSRLPIYNEEYYLKELSGPEEYIISEDIIEIDLEPNEIKTVEVENELKKGNLELIKLDKDTKEPISNVEFELYNSNGEFLQKIVTDDYGKAGVENLKIGEYCLREVKTREEYVLNTDKFEVQINYMENTNLEIYNEKIKGNLKIVKMDKEDTSKKLSGVKFNIFDEESNLVEELITDKDGIAYSSLLPCINRIYTLQEQETLEGYILNDEYTFFKLKPNSELKLSLYNKKEEEEKKQPETKVEIVETPKVEKVKVLPRTGY